MADRARQGEGGFTLLEMLVALAVFSLAALALVRLQGVTLRTAETGMVSSGLRSRVPAEGRCA